MRVTQEQSQTFRTPKVIALTNQNGMKVILTSLGASWVSCILPLATGKRDVVLGSPNMAKQMEQGVYLGSTVEQAASSMHHSTFMQNEQPSREMYPQGVHHLHDEKYNVSYRIWGIYQPSPQKAIFSLTSPMGNEGMADQLDVEVSYELTEDNRVIIHHTYQSAGASLVNLMNHIYFNLAGENSARTALEHDLQIDAGLYLPTDIDGILAGTWLDVSETSFDFRRSKRIGRDFLQDDTQRLVGGYDHSFMLNSASIDGEQTVATLTAPNSDVRLNIATTQPALHLYSGNKLFATSGKSQTYTPYTGVVISAQFPANVMDGPELEGRHSAIALPHQVYKNQTQYQFIF